MAEPSLLCVNCAQPPPAHRRTWDRCVRCAELNLPATYYCGPACMEAHWPTHRQWHKEQKQWAKAWAMEAREGTVVERERAMAEAEARRAEQTGDADRKRFGAAIALMTEGDNHAAAKAWRKIIKERPGDANAFRNLGIVLLRSRHVTDAVEMYLKAMELYQSKESWATCAAGTFDLLKDPLCDDMPKPEWWDDEELKALSARVVALAPGDVHTCTMRAHVLTGDALAPPPWNAGPRTAAEIKEAATWWRRATEATYSPAAKLHYEQNATICDALADPLLAKEEDDAAAARAAAEAEAAKARAAAEAKAKAATEELLAEEEKEKQQAASTKAGKAKHGKGKKGKGKR
tara:strand:+ start:3133 stop:4173 length:1041 start_codon:yes stop_codon:yes gene_type:complete